MNPSSKMHWAAVAEVPSKRFRHSEPGNVWKWDDQGLLASHVQIDNAGMGEIDRVKM